MSDRKNSFLCALPWAHLSVQSSGRLRLCCHDDLGSESTSKAPMLTDFTSLSSRHENPYYANIQRMMIEGDVPSECQSCYQSELAGITSPRSEYNERFTRDGALTYLDITLDNHCNLKCRMCSPKYSQGIAGDWEQLNIPLSEEDQLTLKKPSIGQWLCSKESLDFWNEAVETLELVTITGGEPFLSPYLSEILSRLKSHSKDIELRFYTNTTIFPRRFKEALEAFKKVTIFCSLDGIGEISDYIRFPARWGTVERVYKEYLSWARECSHIDLQVHTVVQAYNINELTALFDFLRVSNPQGVIIPSLTAIESPKLFRLEVLPIEELEEAKSSIDQFFLDHDEEIKGRHYSTHKLQMENLYKMIEKAINQNNSEKKYLEFIALTKRFDGLRNQKFKKFD